MLIFTPQAGKLFRSLRSYYQRHYCDLFIHINAGTVSDPMDHATVESLPFRGEELERILNFLISDGYITHKSHGYVLTYKGKYPIQVRTKSAAAFFIKSIAVPIAVSIITTLITLRITS